MAILLGLIQGLTEFLPVSSSGHLAVAQHFLPGFHQPGLLFDIVLHLGTVLAVLLYFRQEVQLLLSALTPRGRAGLGRRLWVMLALGTLPAVVVALLFGPWVERSFDNVGIAGLGFLITGALLLGSARILQRNRELNQLRWKDAVTVGLFQSAALLPGVSRSGSTIVGGLLSGLSHEAAARFSFLLSVPAILAATVYDLPRVSQLDAAAVGGYLAGFVTAFVVGYLCIGIVLRVLAMRRFHLFGYYCLFAGGTVLVYVTTALS